MHNFPKSIESISIFVLIRNGIFQNMFIFRLITISSELYVDLKIISASDSNFRLKFFRIFLVFFDFVSLEHNFFQSLNFFFFDILHQNFPVHYLSYHITWNEFQLERNFIHFSAHSTCGLFKFVILLLLTSFQIRNQR